VTATLRFHGHACISLTFASGRSMVVDPYKSGSMGGAVALPPLPDTFDLAIATHSHIDHAAFDAVPAATPVAASYRDDELATWSVTAAHDPLGGRLRGGTVQLLVIDVGPVRIAHFGDIGERPRPALVAPFAGQRIDALVLPIGGYFTLGADGAAAWVDALRPRYAVPTHSADDGVILPELAPRADFVRRFAGAQTAHQLDLTGTGDDATRVVVMHRS
jgi:L-ascorbate metabolism protein UlaG (beta-lactamase superfamily)